MNDLLCGDGPNWNRWLQEGLLFGGDCDVPSSVAKCPECGAPLHAENQIWVEETGKPTTAGLYVYCTADPFNREHQTDLVRWADAFNSCLEHFDAQAA